MPNIEREVSAIYHRTKQVNIYPLGGDRFLISAFLQDEIHDVHAEVEIVHPTLEIGLPQAVFGQNPKRIFFGFYLL